MRAVHHEKRANRVVAAPAQPGLGQEQWRGGSLRDEDETLESWGGLRCQLAELARGELCDLETNISNPKTPSTNPRRRRGVRQTAHKLLVGTVSGSIAKIGPCTRRVANPRVCSLRARARVW